MPTWPFKLHQSRRHHIPKQKHKVTLGRLWCQSMLAQTTPSLVRPGHLLFMLGWVGRHVPAQKRNGVSDN